jgi:hypothetical protein
MTQLCEDPSCTESATRIYTFAYPQQPEQRIATCESHWLQAKNLSLALGYPEPVSEYVPAPVEPTEADELRRDLDAERGEHQFTKAALAEYQQKLVTTERALEHVQREIIQFREGNPVEENAALKEQLERVTAELERVTTEYARRNAEAPTTDRPGHVVEGKPTAV